MMQQTMRLSVIIDGETREAVVSVDQAKTALARLERQAKDTAGAVEGAMARASRGIAQSSQLSAQQLQGMQFQLQDMAVGLTSGQSPFTVMMQQGSQLAQSFTAGTGVVAALKSVGLGLVSFVSNPLNLAVLAFGAAASGASLFYHAITDGSAATEQLLDKHRELVEKITAAFKGAKGEAMAFRQALAPTMLLDAQITRTEMQGQILDQRTGLGGRLTQITGSARAQEDQLVFQLEGGLEAYRKIAAAVMQAAPGLETGATKASDLVNTITGIATAAPQGAFAVREFAKQLTDQLQPLYESERALGESEAAIRLLTNSADQADKSLLNSRISASYFGDIPAGVAARTQDFKSLLDLIGYTEGTDRGRGYNETLGFGQFTGGPVDLVTMTLNQVLDLQKRMLADPANTFGSSAVGRYQITSETLRDFMPRLGLTGDTLFSPEVQDRIATAIINMMGRDAGKQSGRWPSLNQVSPGEILRAFDGSASDRVATAEAERQVQLARDKLHSEQQLVEFSKMHARLEKEITEAKKQDVELAFQQFENERAFLDQFRGFSSGLVTTIAQAREETGSWHKAWMAGLDLIEQKALSFLDKFTEKLLDAALFGPEGTAGGGLLGGLIGSGGNLLASLFNPTQNAFGNAFAGGSIVPFAAGGIVSRPTLFPMARGAGLMGEAGPEAIMPLTRMPSGHLGVRAEGGGGRTTVTVNNYAGVPVHTRSRDGEGGGTDLEIIVGDMVNRHIANGGSDGVMGARFGVGRRAEAWG